jgi:ATP-binding cassette subfamily B (MDR/TAP) protein 8
MLLRFYDPSSGSVYIDKYNLNSLDAQWMREAHIGLVSQEPMLFASTILENIRYGRPSATDEEVIEASKLANAHTFIESFPKGYNTFCGERGLALSGINRN